MNFTDQKPRIATDEHVKARWCAGAPGEKFRCYLCGYKFKVGDQWRWVYNNGPDKPCNGNFLVCEKCDGEDVLEKWHKIHEELKKYWWLYDR